jgi:PPOX class probable F420-dependent enzyme
MKVKIDSRIRQFIDSHRVAHLATTGKSLAPHVVPVCFAFDGECFFTAIDEKPKAVAPTELRRVRNIRDNSQVALVLDDYSEDWKALSYLLVHGNARILDPAADVESHAAGVSLLRSKYPQYQSMAIERNPLIQIEPHRLKFWSAA